MFIPRRLVFVICGLLVIGTPTAVADDVTITYKVDYGERGTPIRYKYISPGKAEAWSGPDYGFITESTGRKTRIDHATWQYTETTEQEEEAFRLTQRLPNYGRSAPLKSNSVTFQKLPDHRTIVGLECDHYVVTTRRQYDDAMPRIVVNRHDYWLVPDLHVETARARSFEMGARILEDAPQGVIEDVLSKGLVLAETWSVDDHIFGSEEAIEFRIGAVDPSVFRPPFYYTRAESLSASLIRANKDVEYSEVGTCGQTLFIAAGTDNDENAAWDATKRAWRSCVAERLGEKWTVVQRAQKQCYRRQEKMTAMSRIVMQGTEIVPCGQPVGDPQGKWVCHLDAVPCTAPGEP